MTRKSYVALAMLVACAGCLQEGEGVGPAQQTTDRAQYRELRDLRQHVDRLDANVEGLTQFAEVASGGMPGVSDPSGPITLVGPLPQQPDDDKQRRINLAVAQVKEWQRQAANPREDTPSAPNPDTMAILEEMRQDRRERQEDRRAQRELTQQSLNQQHTLIQQQGELVHRVNQHGVQIQQQGQSIDMLRQEMLNRGRVGPTFPNTPGSIGPPDCSTPVYRKRY